MSNETKRDVLEKLAECYAEVSDAYTNETGSPYYCDDEPNDLDEYDAALPDDLPVIPKAWGYTIKEFKANHYRLSEIFTEWDWNYDEQELIALAWVLGVWRVDETGEIVKLEAEK